MIRVGEVGRLSGSQRRRGRASTPELDEPGTVTACEFSGTPLYRFTRVDAAQPWQHAGGRLCAVLFLVLVAMWTLACIASLLEGRPP